MHILPRRRAWAFVFCLMLVCLAPGFSQPSSVVASSSPCAALRTWAAQYKGTAPTLDALAAFDRPHRIAIFNAVTPAVRAGLMQEHLRRWVEEAGLSAEQRTLIAEGAQLLTPKVYNHGDASERQRWERFWSRAERAFPSDSKRPWFDLVPTPSGISTAAGVKQSRRASMVDCECNVGHPSDCGGGTCNSGGCDQFLGCGPGLIYLCNGTCS